MARAARSARQIVPDDAKVIRRYVCELWATSTFPDGPDPGRARLQPLIDANVATAVELDAGLFEPNRVGVGNAPRRHQDVAAVDHLLAGGRAHDKAHILSGSTARPESLGFQEELNAFASENPLHLTRDVGILPGHELGAVLDDRHLAAEATVGLGHFETDIATPEDDQVCGQIIELQSLDMRERSGLLEARHRGNCRMRSNVEEHLVARKDACPAVIQAHLERSRRHKSPTAHDQLGTALLVTLQVPGNLGRDHVTLALAYGRHVDRDRTADRAELSRVTYQVRDLRAPDLVLTRHAGDVGTGAPDPPALHDDRASAGSRQMPSQKLAPRSTTKDQCVNSLWLGHTFLRVRLSRRALGRFPVRDRE